MTESNDDLDTESHQEEANAAVRWVEDTDEVSPEELVEVIEEETSDGASLQELLPVGVFISLFTGGGFLATHAMMGLPGSETIGESFVIVAGIYSLLWFGYGGGMLL